MELSVIIVNYNVKYFLEQCLCSVKKATEKIQAEVIVVDNNSIDGSIDYLLPKFPWVTFIINKKNEGFSKANNIALSKAKGQYVLFLNPDTIVAEDSFEKCISFMEAQQEAGAVGVKMIDGFGKYLKESKRGFPSPWVSFCKLSGLTALFPHSKIFAKYYLGHLNENENQLIDSISGAFMFARKEALDKTGGFDEQFFMYAEDIDLSYRFQQAGYKNYYLAGTTIIHFKGESTKKDFHYVKLFYSAMSIFAKKHFLKSSFLLKIFDAAIRLRGLFSAIKNLLPRSQSNKKYDRAKIFLYGDLESIKRVEKILEASYTIIVKKEAAADVFIFCEGNTFSFKKIIEALQESKQICHYYFHAGNSNSFSGSNQRNITGNPFLLNP